MSGHSHSNNIKGRKQTEDMKRSRMFSKLSNEIRTCVREGGSDPDFNYRLKSAIQKARDANMPTANIEKAILAK